MRKAKQPVFNAADCKSELGCFFRRLRYKEGLSFRDFANSIRIDEDKLDKIERGIIFPETKIIIKLILNKRTNEKEIFSFLKSCYPNHETDYELLKELKESSIEAKERFLNNLNNENLRLIAKRINPALNQNEDLIKELNLNPQ